MSRRGSVQNVHLKIKAAKSVLGSSHVRNIVLEIFGVMVLYFVAGTTFFTLVESMNIFESFYFCVILFLTIGRRCFNAILYICHICYLHH
jgi:hypothetical protein